MAKPPHAVPATRPKRRPAKARRLLARTGDQPPPEAAVLRDRVAERSPTFVDGPSSPDDVVERMGEDSVMAITTGEDESDDERRDTDRALVDQKAPRDDILFDDIDELGAAEDDGEA